MKRKLLTAAAMAAIYPGLHASSASAAVIDDIYADGAFGIYYSGLEGVVTSVLSTAATTTTFVVQDVNPSDPSASVIAYAIPKSTYTAVVGDDITFSAYDAGYQNAPELVAGNTSNGLFTLSSVNSHGNVVPPAVITIPQAKSAGNGMNLGTGVVGEQASDPYAEAIVTLDNVYFNSSYASLSTSSNTAYYINDHSGNGIELYDYKSDTADLAAVQAADAANPGGFSTTQAYNITGYADVYFGTTEIYPTSITAVAAVPEPTSLGLIALGSFGMLSRRRRRA